MKIFPHHLHSVIWCWCLNYHSIPRSSDSRVNMQLQSIMQSTKARQQLEALCWKIWTPLRNTTLLQRFSLGISYWYTQWENPSLTSPHHWHSRRLSSSVLQPHACQLLTVSKWTVLWGKKENKSSTTDCNRQSETATVEVCRAETHPGRSMF